MNKDKCLFITAGTTLSEYTDLFDEASEKISRRAIVDKHLQTFHPSITGKQLNCGTLKHIKCFQEVYCIWFVGEGSAELIWDNWDWRGQRENHFGNVTNMTYLTFDHLYHVTPNARIITIFRDPVLRYG